MLLLISSPVYLLSCTEAVTLFSVVLTRLSILSEVALTCHTPLYLALTVNSLQVLVPTSQFIRSLVAARLAADVLDVPTVLIARTDAHSAALLTSDVDEVDRAFCTGERTPEGFYRVKEGVKVSHQQSSCRLAAHMDTSTFDCMFAHYYIAGYG